VYDKHTCLLISNSCNHNFASSPPYSYVVVDIAWTPQNKLPIRTKKNKYVQRIYQTFF